MADVISALPYIPGEFWLLLPGAIVVGLWGSWAVFARKLDGDGNPLVRQLSLYRSLLGFGFVVLVSVPYRSTTDTFDDVVGKFDQSVLVASGIMALSFVVLYAAVGAQSRADMSSVIERIVLAVCGFFAWWFASLQLRPSAADGYPAEPEIGWPLIWVATTAFFFSSLFHISRYWFGINRVHPMLGPAVTAITATGLFVFELGFEGPDDLPVRLWLLINVAGLGTTLSVCAWEALEAAAEPDDRPLPQVVAVAGVVCTVAAAAFVLTGAAERTLCGQPVRCRATAIESVGLRDPAGGGSFRIRGTAVTPVAGA